MLARDHGPTLPPAQLWCYLIHFEQPIGNPNEPKGMAGHYLGVTSNLSARLLLHKHKNGSRLMEVVSERSVSWEVAGSGARIPGKNRET